MIPEAPPEIEEMATLPHDADAERDLVGVVVYDGNRSFKKAAVKSCDFFILRWRWFWEACISPYRPLWGSWSFSE